MKTEVSAGGIVVRKRHGVWEIMLVQDKNDAWTFPKGLVEKTENYENAATREIREEVGLSGLKLCVKLPLVRYMYQKNGFISKTVHYFLFRLTRPQKAVSQKEEGIHNATWIPLHKAIEIIGYPKTNRPLLLNVKQWTSHQHRT